jgi:hypothetical protein
MVSRTLVCSVVVVLASLAGSTCKVINEDHCANQELPGNEFCLELNTATPYCSPCRREYHGCVDYEPFACGGYDNEIGESQDGDGPSASSTSDEPESTSDAPVSTSDASTSSGSTGSSDTGSGSDGSGSGTAGSSG